MNASNNYESWAGLCLGWLVLVCFKFLVYSLFWERQLIYLISGELWKEKHFTFKMQVNTTLGKYRIWDTNLSLPSLPPCTPPRFLAGTPCLCLSNVLGNRVILLGSGRTPYSAPFVARQTILAGVIGEGCRRQTKGHSSLAAFLKRRLGRRRCPWSDCTAALKEN